MPTTGASAWTSAISAVIATDPAIASAYGAARLITARRLRVGQGELSRPAGVSRMRRTRHARPTEGLGQSILERGRLEAQLRARPGEVEAGGARWIGGVGARFVGQGHE